MKAILINEDKSLRWDNVPDPVLEDDQCLIIIEAAGANLADLLQREVRLQSQSDALATRVAPSWAADMPSMSVFPVIC